MTPSLVGEAPVYWWTSSWLFHGQAGIYQKIRRSMLRHGHLRQQHSFTCTASEKMMFPETDCDMIPGYGGCLFLSTDHKAGFLRGKYLWFRHFHGTPKPHPTCQCWWRVEQKCSNVCIGQSFCLDVTAFHFWSQWFYFQSKVIVFPWRWSDVLEMGGVPWRDMLGLSFQQLQSTCTPVRSMAFAHLPQLQYLSCFCMVIES